MSNLRATIDIGSNSVLLLLGEVSPYKEMAKLSEVTSLGKNLDKTKMFSTESMDETYRALKSYAAICLSNGLKPSEIIATATEASRVAINAKEFFSKIKNEIGINVQIISGKKEAELTAKGILFDSTFETEHIIVMDIGGASTELILLDTVKKEVLRSISLKVGSVRATDWLSEGVFKDKFYALFDENKNLIEQYHTSDLYCVAGTLTSLGNMHLEKKQFIEDEVHGLVLTSADIRKMFQLYSDWDPNQFLETFPFLGKRAHAIRGGLFLTHYLLERLNVEKIVVSTYGLRYGSFIEGEVR